MGSKTRLSSYCTKRANNGVNLVTSRNINTRLARPMGRRLDRTCNVHVQQDGCVLVLGLLVLGEDPGHTLDRRYLDHILVGQQHAF